MLCFVRMLNALIIGGTGLISTGIVKHLVARGAQVTIYNRGQRDHALLPDGVRRTLLRIPDWNFNWQRQYRYASPIRLPEDTRIEMEFTYDNSAANVRNPHNPPQRITWGPGSADEMAGLHIEVAPDDEDDAEELSQALWGKMMRQRQPLTPR